MLHILVSIPVKLTCREEIRGVWGECRWQREMVMAQTLTYQDTRTHTQQRERERERERASELASVREVHPLKRKAKPIAEELASCGRAVSEFSRHGRSEPAAPHVSDPAGVK